MTQRKNSIRVYLDDAEKEKVQELATEVSLRLSSYARMILLQQIKK